jgi:hypothetical protein
MDDILSPRMKIVMRREWMMTHRSGELSSSLSWLLVIIDQLMDEI